METEQEGKQPLTSPSASSPGSQASAQAERTTPIERLFARFAAIYGAKFSRLWAGADPAEIKAAWTEQLARYPVSQITRAVNLCATEIEQPPTLPEFVKMVRAAYRPDEDAAPASPYLTQARTALPYRPDTLDAQVRREYPREAAPPYRNWARQILRLAALGRAMPHCSVKAAETVTGKTVRDFA